MARKQHTMEEALKSLRKKTGCSVKDGNIEIHKNHTDLGNGSWGKIDYLEKIHKFRVYYN